MKQMDALYDAGMIDRSCAEDAIPPGLIAVLDEFHRQRVSYCYWKSSRRVHDVLAGAGDVDLLVARADQHCVQAILVERDFKLFPSVADRDHPATMTFFGYDERSGLLIHVHLHFLLIVGERLVKNYRIPWEEFLLTRAILHPTLPIRILEPASEAVLLVVRACLELRRLDLMTLCVWQATTRKFALDRTEFVARLDRSVVRERAAELLDAELGQLVEDTLYSDQPLETQAKLRRRLQRYFAAFRSYNAVEARMRSMGRALRWLAGSLNKHVLQAPRPWNRRASGGGCMVAMMGVDGSGKSTSVATMRAWLGAKVDVVPIYFGTGDGRPSLLLWPLKSAMPLIRRMLRSKPRVPSHGNLSGPPPGALYSLLLIVWAAAVALDKRKKLAAAQRATSRGLIVLTDRYPQSQIIGFNDGPLLSRLTRVPHWLRRFEAASYNLACRLPPDLVIKLVVTPETAARREPTMDPAVIQQRVAALQQLKLPGARIVCIDAEQPLAEVVRAVKREIWRLI